ncbi:nitroreductase family protein [Longispora fulva]|uniref:3-hydroxypropanoate dehydrogenase n=1 Tax=Longispora fulva TaxID=619741 RepID=A0A8J7GIQ7_9ACTN|nr:malonic semialdehyde reductase [Longispora fulva]MBG6137467.1 3-hydroxypropanoate dehydrogenase [Longispora fulva]GIG61178.1 nitroreductase family protein [Longispora fulva]
MSLATDAQDLLFRAARTANTFTDEPVTDTQVHAIYDLIRFGPTGANAQPLRIVLVRTPEARARLLTHVSATNGPKIAAAPLVAILAADTRFHETLPRLFPHNPGARDWYADPAFRESQARFNASIQIGYLLVGIRAAGLSAGPMGGFDAPGVDKDFFPDGRLRSQLLVNIGRPGPNAWQARLPRLEPTEVITTV